MSEKVHAPDETSFFERGREGVAKLVASLQDRFRVALGLASHVEEPETITILRERQNWQMYLNLILTIFPDVSNMEELIAKIEDVVTNVSTLKSTQPGSKELETEQARLTHLLSLIEAAHLQGEISRLKGPDFLRNLTRLLRTQS